MTTSGCPEDRRAGATVQALSRLIPRRWRNAVVRDLVEEAERSVGRPVWQGWLAWHVAVIGLSFRWHAVHRTIRGGIPTRTFSSDLRDAWRAFGTRRGAAVAIVLVLALGTGLTSAMFALADPYLWRPLPFRDADRLVVLAIDNRALRKGTSIPTLDDWRRRTDLFEDVAAMGEQSTLRLDRDHGAIAVTALAATGNLFDVLGLQTSWTNAWRDDSQLDTDYLALLATRSDAVAEAQASIGSTLPIQGGGRARFVGALPSWFVIPMERFTRFEPPDALIRVPNGPVVTVSRWSNEGRPSASSSLNVLARVRPGLTPAALEGALAVPVPSGPHAGVTATPLRDLMTARLRPLAVGAFSAGLLILLISAANIANLMVARGVFRERELATRQALGATRWDLVRLVLTELVLIATAGAAAGLGVAAVALTGARLSMPVQYAALGAPAITLRVTVFAAATAVVVMAVGLMATVALRRVTPRTLMSQRASSETRAARTVRFAMAAAQAAIAMVLVAGAAFLIRSYLNLTGQDTGYGHDVVAVAVSYDAARRREPLRDAVDAAIDAFRRMPRVASSAAATGAMADGYMSASAWRPPTMDKGALMLSVKAISAGYLETVGNRLIAGRTLSDADRATGAILVNRSFARHLSADGTAVGREARLTNMMGRPQPGGVVVGVVDDTFDDALDRAPMPTVFIPLDAPEAARQVTYVLRTDLAAEDVRREARQIFARLDPSAVVVDVARMHDRLAGSVQDRSFATLVLSFFATAGVIVSLTGIVAIVLFVVARRTKEVAIRVTLGATPGLVRLLILRDVLSATATGLGVGLVASFWLSRSIETLLFNVPAGDAITLAIAATVMIAAASIAAAIPARRATMLQPTAALRVD